MVHRVGICVGNYMLFDIISRGNSEVISRGEAECHLAISESNCIQNCTKKDVIGERAKRARHSQVCSIENRIYIIVRANFVLITRKEGGA